MNNEKLIINPFVIMGLSTAFIIGCIILSLPLYIGFILGIIFTVIVLNKSGFKFNTLIKIIWNSIFEVKHLCIIILLIGATTSIWLSSGVVPTIMFYGFSYMENINFLLAAFLIMVTVSVFMGTAVGTVSTVGISMYGIGLGLGIPVEIIVGVLVSGAFIADKISPLSGLVNLAMTTMDRSYKQILKGSLITLIPTLVITAAIYYIIGLKYTVDDLSRLNFYQNAISQGFNTTPILLMLPVIVITLSVLGVNSITTISIGLVTGTALSMIFQKQMFINIFKSVIFGYHGSTASEELNKMLVSGGVVSMIDVVFVVMGGIVLVKLFQEGNILMPLMNKLLSGIKTPMNLILKTSFVSSLLTAVTCDQSVGIILTGKVLKDKYKEFNMDIKVLARTISDTSTIIAPLMAWNVNSFIIKGIVGISAEKYWPYAVLCFVCPIVTFVVSYIQFGDKRFFRKKHVKTVL